MGQTILVVDDEPAILEVLCDMLRSVGMKVIGASSGLEALGILEKEQVDAIVSDVMMPAMTGPELLKEVRKSRTGLPAILITGNRRSVSSQDVHDAGAEACLFKPINMASFIEAVKSALNR